MEHQDIFLLLGAGGGWRWLAAPHRAESANYDCVPIYQTHIGSLDTTGAPSSEVNIAGTPFMS